MNAQDNGCDRQRIDAFLSSDHVGLDDRHLVDHLNSCAACRKYMESQAAEPESWSKAAELLRPSEFDHASSAEHSAATIGHHRAEQPIVVQTILDSLAPSDEPNCLGRLGAYEISGVVGNGGMGVVFKAVDPSLDRVVAIKVMAPHLAHNATARKRFSREAKAAAAVLHPNVIPIYCVSTDNVSTDNVSTDSVSTDSAIPYLVMAYIRGGSLQKRLERVGPLPTVEILRIGAQIAAGLAAAHEQGLVHRDIKPENILLEEGVERVTLTDFGLARAVDDASVTRDGTIAGTPQYMSPEQARGESVDQKSDLFSLGSVLYALCTGRPPFRAETSYGVMRRISDETPTPIRELNPEIPEWLSDIIERLMSKQKADRFEAASEVHELLEAYLSHVQQPTAVQLPSKLLTKTTSTTTRKGLLSRFHVRAEKAGIRKPHGAASHAVRLAHLLGVLPLFAIVWIGFYSHTHFGTEGIVGVLLGLYGIGYLTIAARRWDPKHLTAVRRFMLKYRTPLLIVSILCIAGGALDMSGISLFSPASESASWDFGEESSPLMVGGGASAAGEGWSFLDGSLYLQRNEPGVLFGMYEDPAGRRAFSYAVLFRHSVSDTSSVTRPKNAGLTFDGEVASMTSGITIDGKGIQLALELQVDKRLVKSTKMTIDGRDIDPTEGRLFLVDLTSDSVTCTQSHAKFPSRIPDPQDMAQDTAVVAKLARHLTQQLKNDCDSAQAFLAKSAAQRLPVAREVLDEDAKILRDLFPGYVLPLDRARLAKRLTNAIEKNDESEVERSLNEGAEVDWTGASSLRRSDTQSPLFKAIRRGNPRIVEALLKRGARVGGATREQFMQSRNQWSQTPLYFAVRCGNREIVDLLIKYGASISAVNFSGKTPIIGAVEDGNLEMFEHLLSQGAVCDFELRLGKDRLSLASVICEHSAEYYVPPFEDQCDRVPAGIHGLAGLSGNAKLIAAVNEQFRATPDYGPALQAEYAVKCGDTETLRKLIADGYDPTQYRPKNTLEPNLLGWAEEFGHAEMVALLSEAGVKRKSTNGSKPSIHPVSR